MRRFTTATELGVGGLPANGFVRGPRIGRPALCLLAGPAFITMRPIVYTWDRVLGAIDINACGLMLSVTVVDLGRYPMLDILGL